MYQHQKRITELALILLLIVLVFIFFGEILCSGQSLFGSDFVLQFYPWKKFIYDHVRTYGNLPYWNPYLFSGTPFIANIQTSMFYPLGFLYYIIDPESAYVYATMLHCLLGSFFMFVFMRILSVSPWGAILSAIIFTYNGYFIGHLYAGHLSFVQNYIWIPLIFCFLYRFFQTIRFKYAVLTGLVLGIQILGGFPQIAFYTIMGLLAFSLYHGFVLLRNGTRRDTFKLAVGLFIILFVGFSLAAIQILPSIEFLGHSIRAGGVSYEFATYDSFHPKEIFSFLLPDIYGNVIDGTYWLSNEGHHFWETCGYVGILPLFFLFIKIENPSLRILKFFFIGIIVMSLFLALGKHNPFYPIIYRLPGFHSFRVPAQIIFLYVFSVSVLSGMGMHRLQEYGWELNKGWKLFFPITGVLLLLLMVSIGFFPVQLLGPLFKHFAEGSLKYLDVSKYYNRLGLCVDKAALIFFSSFLVLTIWRSRKLNQWLMNILVLVIVVLDLYMFSSQFIQPYLFSTSPEKKHIVGQLNRDPVQGRVVTISDYFMPNDGLRYRFPSILGYDPLILRRYSHYVQSTQNVHPEDHVINLSGINNPSAKLLKLLHVRQLIFREKVTLLEHEVPYARIVNKAIIRPFEKVLCFMESDEFDPKRMVVLEPGYRSKLISLNEGEPFHSSCSIIDYENESIRIRASTDRPGYLVLSEIFYPGWQATVDGERVPVLRGNYLFRVIALDKGEHEIHLYYISWPFRIGLIISLSTLMASMLFIRLGRKEGVIDEKR